MFVVISLFLLAAEFIWQLKINYPPTLQQLHLSILNPQILWASRVAGFFMLLVTTVIISRFVPQKIKKYYWVLVLASPTFSVLWMSYPIDILKLFLIVLPFFFLKFFPKKWIIVFGLSASILLILNLIIFKENPSITNAFSFTQAQKEITHRFIVEDSLTPHVEVPLWLRRIGYNKYFIVIKNVLNESLPFFNLETFFFQEVHPLNQKGTAIFFWPEIFIFIVGLWFFILKKDIPNKLKITFLFILSFLYFITTNASMERRLFFTLFPLAILMSWGIDYAFRSRIKILKLCMFFILGITMYGWATNLYDRSTRTGYWLDNRPMAYQFIFNSLQDLPLQNYNQVVLSDTLYLSKEYCVYYLSDCSLISNQPLDLSKEKPEPNTLYVGFIGNFLGPNRENSFSSNYQEQLSKRGFTLLNQTKVYDNIADGYGQDIVVAEFK